MADIKINEKLVVSQTGTAEPVLASNVDLSSATGIPAAGITGTLGSGVAFPAGHIIQTAYNQPANSGVYATTTSSTFARVQETGQSGEAGHYWKCAITGVKASSHIFILTTFSMRFYRPHTEAAGTFGLLRDDDGAGTNLETLYVSQGNQHHIQINASGQSYWLYQSLYTNTYKHTSPATGNNTYYLGWRSDGTTQLSIESSSNQSEEPFRMMLMEIAQ